MTRQRHITNHTPGTAAPAAGQRARTPHNAVAPNRPNMTPPPLPPRQPTWAASYSCQVQAHATLELPLPSCRSKCAACSTVSWCSTRVTLLTLAAPFLPHAGTSICSRYPATINSCPGHLVHPGQLREARQRPRVSTALPPPQSPAAASPAPAPATISSSSSSSSSSLGAGSAD